MTKIYQAYLFGALHDGTINRLHQTARFFQKESEWLELLKYQLNTLGYRAWLYREGKERNVYALETKASFLFQKVSPFSFESEAEQIAYIRGYFDAEGGIPSQSTDRLYIQFVQKNLEELTALKSILENLHISSGIIHNPSKKVDPNYFRFFISTKSHEKFIQTIGSWHPRKAQLFNQRMKI